MFVRPKNKVLSWTIIIISAIVGIIDLFTSKVGVGLFLILISVVNIYLMRVLDDITKSKDSDSKKPE